jgi:hypothetical protein
MLLHYVILPTAKQMTDGIAVDPLVDEPDRFFGFAGKQHVRKNPDVAIAKSAI